MFNSLPFTLAQTTDVNVEQLRSNLSDLEMMVVMLEGQLGQTLVEGVNYPVTLSGVTLNSECTTDFEELCTVMPPSEVPGSSNISCPDTPFNVTADEEQKVSCIVFCGYFDGGEIRSILSVV